jgi:tripartite-type tricarboxylate transporter receptor subunit TctC
VINPVAPGGVNDIIGRAFASVAEKYLGQPMFIVNKPGASGVIGTLEGAQAAPDGYTLTIASSSRTTTVEWEIANGRKPPFTRHDFALMGSFTLSPPLVIVPQNSPWKTLSDLISDCKAKRSHYAFCSSGPYSMSHIPVELLSTATGIKCRHVPYPGAGPCLTAVIGGHVDFSTQYLSSSIPLIRGNKIRALTVMGDKRIKDIPDVPTARELGLNAEYYVWVGILAPGKTPAPIVEKLRDVLKKVTEEKSFIKTIENLGDEVRYMSAEQLARHWDNDSETLSKLYKQLIEEQK